MDNNLPQHIAIILDGNRRWAKKRGLPILAGHKQGVETLKKIIKHCQKIGIKTLTVFAFSTENWKRSKKEVDYLMKLLELYVKKEGEKTSKEGICIRVLGEMNKLPRSLQKELTKIIELTKDNLEFHFNIALNYGGRAEIVKATKKIVASGTSPKAVNEDLITQNLCTASLPDPDLVIRPGGEKRVSNFLLWQIAYSELYFANVLWPDFNEKQLDLALAEFKRRKRRFGK